MSAIVDTETGEVIEKAEGRHIRPFTEWLLEQRGGACVVELGESLNDLVESVNMLGKGGKLTLTVKVEPSSRGGNSIVLVTDEIALAKPKPKAEPGIFFVDKDANLSRANPNQDPLPLREVPPPTNAVKEV